MRFFFVFVELLCSIVLKLLYKQVLYSGPMFQVTFCCVCVKAVVNSWTEPHFIAGLQHDA